MRAPKWTQPRTGSRGLSVGCAQRAPHTKKNTKTQQQNPLPRLGGRHQRQALAPAAGHVGFYGWLRATNARVQRLSQSTYTLLDIATVAGLRAAYAEGHHPRRVAQDALRASPRDLAA